MFSVGVVVASVTLNVLLSAQQIPTCHADDREGSTADLAARVRKIVDISVPIENGASADPPACQPKVRYENHARGLEEMQRIWTGLKAEDLPGGDGWAIEHVDMCTHSGTHVDAPWHYSATMADGSRPMTISEVPLEWCFGPGVKLDFRHLPDGHVVEVDELTTELDRIGHKIRPGDIILVNTAAGTHYGETDYLFTGVGLGKNATEYLTARGVRMMGTDAWSWDAPFSYTARRFKSSGDASIVWEGHKAGRVRPYAQVEKLHNLEALPARGFAVAVFPVNVKDGSGGWARAVAML